MSSSKIWQTGADLHPLVEAFTVGDDYLYDQELIPYDIKASLAHAKMLYKIKILDKNEFNKTKKGLNEILDLWSNNKFKISQSQEDCHTAIEQFLTSNYGQIGKKIHTGRSRNDQALVMMRLFSLESLEKIEKLNQKLIQVFSNAIKKTKNIPMPGYTHMQKAMPTTVGVWLDSYLSALIDFKITLKSTQKLINQNPLGSASGFGIANLAIDREATTKDLGFAKIQKNPIYCNFSRGYFENIILQNLSQIMIALSRFASDMLIFTTQEFGFFSLPANFTTGSSIMPQKKNYDLFEIMRGNVKVFSSYQNQIQEIIFTLRSGYNRDLQLTKKPFVAGLKLALESLEIMIEIIPNIKIHQKKLKSAMTPDLYATEKVYELVKQGKSFREAYIEIKKNLSK